LERISPRTTADLGPCSTPVAGIRISHGSARAPTALGGLWPRVKSLGMRRAKRIAAYRPIAPRPRLCVEAFRVYERCRIGPQGFTGENFVYGSIVVSEALRARSAGRSTPWVTHETHGASEPLEVVHNRQAAGLGACCSKRLVRQIVLTI